MKIIDKYLENIMFDKNIKVRVNVSCGIIMKKGPNGENLVLILRRSPDDHWPLFWDISRGKCDGGNDKNPKKEKLIPCLKREVREETGLNVIPVHYIDKFIYLADRGTRETTQYNFVCKMKNPNQEVKLSKEHDEYRWISTIGEAELMLQPEMKKILTKVLNPIEQIVTYPDSEMTDDTLIEQIKNDNIKD